MARQVSIKWNASGAIRIVTRATVKATKALMEDVKDKAVEYCPLDKGDLRNSARVAYYGTSTVCYFEEPYALIQHENLEYRHRVGQAKYLERAFNEVMPHCRYTVQDAVNQDLAGG
jgi:hypothetical protein